MKMSITPEPLKTIMPTLEPIDCQIPRSSAGMRLDQALAELLPDYSRSRLQQWLKAGQLRVDGQIRRPRDAGLGGETSAASRLTSETVAVAQDIPLHFCYRG
jgi:23S rRNA pseudouridine1911/1915/1917 synthase